MVLQLQRWTVCSRNFQAEALKFKTLQDYFVHIRYAEICSCSKKKGFFTIFECTFTEYCVYQNSQNLLFDDFVDLSGKNEA